MKEIPKTYDIASTEAKWIKFWEENKLYNASPDPSKPKYSIVIPPPNVTGVLHIGHILNNTVQDIYSRWKRMQGYEVCWVPGTDHAGIATQQVVEKQIAKEGKSKNDFGREEFIKIVWQWKEKYGGHILQQLRRLGASVDWSKERFTMDEGLSKAVREVFVDLYKKGLIYRGKRIVNWDPKSQTAVSDDEIVYKEKTDKLYFIKYKLADSDDFLTVATTRPETMFGDTGVAVNPKDKRYIHYINKEVILPLVKKKIPVIGDDYVDMEFGSGALKITPAHDINDFEIGKRHNLESLNVLTKDSKLNEHGLEFQGMDIFKARKLIVKKLEEEGLLLKTEEFVHNVAYGERSDAVIEPYLSEQWFVSMKPLAEPAIKAVESGEIKFHPKKWEKTYFHWMRNVKDWCISRQLWWGHQIPIWYHNETGEIYCEAEPPKDIENWTQDPDVLDTWFSSWLWPFSVFGWENSEKDKKNTDLQYFYPTDFLSTGAEIIYLWVARMIMAGLEYMKEIPFKDVYFNSIVRDGQGRKMSKSLGNSPEPMDIMDKYGTDALRFTMVYLAPLGNDVLFEEKNTEIGRNFVTKLWNAGRFLQMNTSDFNDLIDEVEPEMIDLAFHEKFKSVINETHKLLNKYELNEYAKILYNFVWQDFCDVYIESLKIRSKKDNNFHRLIIGFNHFKMILKLLHPIIPYVTEELWSILTCNDAKYKSISFEQYPVMIDEVDLDIIEHYEQSKMIESGTKRIKKENQIPLNKVYDVEIEPLEGSKFKAEILKIITQGLSSNNISIGSNIVSGDSTSEVKYNIKFGEENIKINREKEIQNLEKYIKKLDLKIKNENFRIKAPQEIFDIEVKKLIAAKERLMILKKSPH